jgi:tumor protein p53-inducible protein 3
MRAVRVKENVKDSSSLYINDKEPIPTPKDDQVLIKVHAAGLNRADVSQRMGAYPPPPGASDILGLEVAGVIEQVGPNVTNWKKGDRVMALLDGGGYAEYAIAHKGTVMPVPGDLSLEEAAAIPEVFLTAYQTAFFIGKVDQLKRKNVLVHAAASGVGTALIQLCKVSGVENIVATCSKQKIEQVSELGATLVIDRAQEWDKKIIESIKGVDFILDPVGKDYFNKNLNVMNADALVVGIAVMSGAQVENVDLSIMLRKRLTVLYSTLRARTKEYKQELVESFVKWTHDLRMFENGSLKPITAKVFNIEQVAQAHDYMESNSNVGKIILRIA